MKKVFSFPIMMALALLSITSCKKNNDTTPPAGSGNLGAGKSSISFTNSGSFAGGTTFKVSNTAATQAVSSAGGSSRSIVLSATEISGTNTRSAGLIISVPANASTASGNLNSDFSNPGNAVILPSLTLSSTTGSANGTSYISQSGTCTITKLTATEIEGTFSCVVKDANGAGTLSLTSGTFAGKF
jgi:hypothetical protein